MLLLPLSFSAAWTILCLFFAILIVVADASDLSFKPLQAAHFEHHAKPIESSDDTEWPQPFTFSLPNAGENYVRVTPMMYPEKYNIPFEEVYHQITVHAEPRHHERPSCTDDDLNNILVNGQRLKRGSLTLADTKDSQLFTQIPVQDTISGKLRWINIVIDTKCYPSDTEDDLGSNGDVAELHSWKVDTPVLGISLFLVLDVDGKPWAEQAFTVSTSLLNGHIATAQVLSPDSPESTDFLSISSNSEEETEEPDVKAVQFEINKLSELKHQLKTSKEAVTKQEELVNSLLGGAHRQLVDDLKSCGVKDVPCIFKALFEGGKDCFDLLVTRFKLHAFGPDPDPCYGMSEGHGSTRVKVLTAGSHNCSPGSNKHGSSSLRKGHHRTLLADDKSASDSPIHSQIDLDRELGGSSHSGIHAVHTAIGIVASIFCLVCVAQLLHRRCCNPRARADRAARREERRARRQHRCAARRQALKDWWSAQQARFSRGQGRCGSRRTNDYEEKRSLILQQEQVLENAMQDEIQELHHQARRARGGPLDDVLAMVEEGRGGSPSSQASSRRPSHERRNPLYRTPSPTETLPPYRSRASSGRPPSYNEFDQHATSSITSVGSETTVNGYTNTRDEDGRSLRSFRSFRTNATPASSVVSLSPRNSSETLRSERSIF